MRWVVPAAALLVMTAASAAADDTAKLAELFAKSRSSGEVLVIPPGEYSLDGLTPIPLHSGLTVSAYGARFHLPESLGDQPRRVLFSGENLTDLRWFGGHFTGHVFDPARETNLWPPHANTRPIVISTKPDGRTGDLLFRDLSSDEVAGAVVTVLGAEKPGSEREVTTFAKDVTVEHCHFRRSGKFMWDYGYLWQITVWPEEFGTREHALASKYFRNDLVRGPIRMEEGDDRVRFDNSKRLPVTRTQEGAEANRGHEAICFFGDTLPRNIVRGRQYFVIESERDYVRIADSAGGPPIRFEGNAGPNAKLIADLFQSHLALYAPSGSGPGKGAIDLVACEKVIVTGCRLSALGDTMHIQKCNGIVFSGNHITGSRMGAFFLAEYCRDATVTGNTVDGTNGSRVVSVEKSCQDVTIVSNTFRNGGRGSWINQPRNFVLADNIFVNNTTKCEPDPKRGRRTFLTGEYETYSELYFTTHEPGGRYGNVIVRGNVFSSGDHAACAINFASGGDTILVADNIFAGKARQIDVGEGCSNVTIRGNQGLEGNGPAEK